MAHYVVHVQWRDGTPATGRRVSLGFSGLFSGGVTETVYTNQMGVAILQASCGGSATVYVDGRDRGITAPGDFVVTLK